MSDLPIGAEIQANALAKAINLWHALQKNAQGVEVGTDPITGVPMYADPTMVGGWLKMKSPIKMTRQMKVTGGENLLQYPNIEAVGKHLLQLGPKPRIRTKAHELAGAQLLDEFGAPIEPAVAARAKKEGVVGNIKQIVQPLESGVGGQADALNREITYSPEHLAYLQNTSQHPSNAVAGLGAHEVQHLIDMLSTKNIGRPMTSRFGAPIISSKYTGLYEGPKSEILPPSTENLSNRFIKDEWLTDPNKLNYALDTIRRTQPDKYAELMALSSNTPQFYSKLASTIRNWGGTQVLKPSGFPGTNPAGIDILTTLGHFAQPIESTADIPLLYLSKQQVRAGGELPEYWMNRYASELEPLKRGYTSTAQQGYKLPTNPWRLLMPAAAVGGLATLTSDAPEEDQQIQPEPETVYLTPDVRSTWKGIQKKEAPKPKKTKPQSIDPMEERIRQRLRLREELR
jgi:hypothetical protein